MPDDSLFMSGFDGCDGWGDQNRGLVLNAAFNSEPVWIGLGRQAGPPSGWWRLLPISHTDPRYVVLTGVGDCD